MTAYGEYLAAAARRREAAGLTRALAPRGPRPSLIDLSSNDYLGLARNPEVRDAAAAAAREWGAGTSSSRLVTGSLALHHELEDELARATRQPSALVFSTGYHANLSIVTALADKDTLIVSDAHIHASLVDAARLSKARVAVVPHNDVSAVHAALSTRSERRALVLSESIYSVLGDAAPLVELAALAASQDALLIVDEAHGLGTVGADGLGMVRDLGLAGSPHVAVTATLSKALGSQGGVVLGSSDLREHLVNTARPFIYDTGLAPAAAAGALAALRVLRREPGRAQQVTHLAGRMAEALGASAPDAAVFSVAVPGPEEAVAATAAALVRDVRVGCFRPPSVPDGVSRLRMTASAGLSDVDVARAVAVVSDCLANVRGSAPASWSAPR